LSRATWGRRGFRISWFIVGILTPSSTKTARRRCRVGAIKHLHQE
jgi:hypothetical protein